MREIDPKRLITDFLELANSKPSAKWTRERSRLALIRGYMAESIRKAFRAEDLELRDWFLFLARHCYAEQTQPMLSGLKRSGRRITNGGMPPTFPVALGSYWDTMLRFVQQKKAKKMGVCANPDCKRPFFFRVDTANRQSYCEVGGECAKLGGDERRRRSYRKKRRAKRFSV
jgi:hypothetical protein